MRIEPPGAEHLVTPAPEPGKGTKSVGRNSLIPSEPSYSPPDSLPKKRDFLLLPLRGTVGLFVLKMIGFLAPRES